MLKKIWSLVDFEMGRFLKFLLPTYIIVAIIQIYSMVTTIFDYNSEIELMTAQGMDLADLSNFSGITVTSQFLFSISIMLLVLVFIFYSFFTWYREWLGKNSFIYRLLMLPIKRIYIFIAKAVVFLIGGFLTFVFQFGMYGLVLFVSKQMIQPKFYQTLNIHQIRPAYDMLQMILFPQTGIEFLYTYGFAFAALVTLFTAIIIERSYGLKGLFTGIAYFMGYFILILIIGSSNYIEIFPFITRPSHAYIATIITEFLVIILGLTISNYLMKSKVKV